MRYQVAEILLDVELASHTLCVTQTFTHPSSAAESILLFVCLASGSPAEVDAPGVAEAAWTEEQNYIMSRSHPGALEQFHAIGKLQIMVWST